MVQYDLLYAKPPMIEVWGGGEPTAEASKVSARNFFKKYQSLVGQKSRLENRTLILLLYH